MFDLNDIYRKLGLKGRKQPSDWTNKVKSKLYETGNLRSRRVEGSKEGGWQTLATLKALYAYAMWVDVDFYMVVVEAFAALTLGNTEEAEKIVPLI